MKKFKSHKTVEACKIIEVVELNNKSFLLKAENQNVYVGEEYYHKHKPKSGGYFVKYEDGYESFSPAHAFESGYTEIDDNQEKEECTMESKVLQHNREDHLSHLKLTCVEFAMRIKGGSVTQSSLVLEEAEEIFNFITRK